MEEWKEYKLEEICTKITDGSHFSPQACQTGYPMFSVKDMHEYGFDYSNCKHISAKDFESMKNGDCVPQKGDILVAKDGSFLKQIFECKETKEEAILSSIAIFRPNQNIITPTFLCYLLKSPKVYNYIALNCVSGSALPRIVLKDFKKVTMQVPPLPTQQKIATILSSLDDKIELNNKINTNLEQQAGALFKNWFVDFEPFDGKMPEEWRIGKVGDLGEIICGKTPSTKIKEYYGNECPFITIPDMHNNVYACFTERYLSKLGMESQIGKSLPVNSVCVSCIATPGLVILTDKISQTNQQINSIIPNKNMSSYYVYLLMQSLAETIKMLGSSGSTTSNLNKDQFSKIDVLIPAIYELKIFNSIVEPLFQNIRNNIHENQKLTALRDTLLPKLMSGEIDVESVKI